MTVPESIINWLNEYTGAEFSDIDPEILESQEGSYAISRSPNRNVVEMIDGSKDITEFYQFFARQNIQTSDEVLSNIEFMENLERWIDEQEMIENYPDLSQCGNMDCMEVGISNYSTITSLEDDIAIYQITINIRYIKEV